MLGYFLRVVSVGVLVERIEVAKSLGTEGTLCSIVGRFWSWNLGDDVWMIWFLVLSDVIDVTLFDVTL